VAAHLALERRFLADAAPPPGASPGLFICNPPYGRRVTEVTALGPLYAEIGRVLAARFAGWRAAIVSGDPRLDHHLGLPRRGETPFLHGGLHCRLIELAVAAARGNV
jgi:23S rRNA (guanine2445-N2)-methyltransferase / 23S rRNA (guanine2069-N7)-methyltransferase